jgi:cytochrome P450
LPAGYAVASIATLVHMREDLYPAAGEFQPQRFLQRKYSPFEFVPFGGGTHRCLGATFAFYEMKVVLAALLRHCRFSIYAATAVRPRRQQSFPFGPHGAFKLVLESRRIPPSRYDPATSESRPSQG